MINKLKTSLSRINYKLFAALLVLGLAPTIYTTVRVFFLGQLPGEYSFSIAGQLSWVNLLYEIMNEEEHAHGRVDRRRESEDEECCEQFVINVF